MRGDTQYVGITGIQKITKTLSNINPVLQLTESNYDFVRLTFTNTASANSWVVAALPTPVNGDALFNINYAGLDAFSLAGNGNGYFPGVVVATSFTQNSDKRLKENIKPLENALSNIQRVNGYTYNWKDKSKGTTQQIGFIAQELEEIFPQLVTTDNKGMKSVAYANMVTVLLEAIKEQQKEIDELKVIVKEKMNK